MTVALNTEDMNRIIDSYTAHVKNSNLRGHGGAFIQASRETGLNPIYILAHAIIESGNGTSYLARNRYNFFGIAAYDNNPGAAYAPGLRPADVLFRPQFSAPSPASCPFLYCTGVSPVICLKRLAKLPGS